MKLTLYRGIHEVVSKNPELCEAVVELLHGHLVALMGERVEVALERVVGEVDGEVVVVEPAGWFLHTVQAIVQKGVQVLEPENAELLERLVAKLDRIPHSLGLSGGFSPVSVIQRIIRSSHSFI